MITFEEIRTLKDLLEALNRASPEQLEQSAQTIMSSPCDEDVNECCPVMCIGTIDELGLRYTRSSVDNRRHGEELVILVDYNPHAEDGAIAYEYDCTEKDSLKKPIYPHDYDNSQNWTGPAQKIADAKKKKKVKGTVGMQTIRSLEQLTKVNTSYKK